MCIRFQNAISRMFLSYNMALNSGASAAFVAHWALFSFVIRKSSLSENSNFMLHISNVISKHLKKNLKTQEHLNNISDWTRKKQMKLNCKKTKNIIFNFSRNNKFSTDLKISLGSNILEVVFCHLFFHILMNTFSYRIWFGKV